MEPSELVPQRPEMKGLRKWIIALFFAVILIVIVIAGMHLLSPKVTKPTSSQQSAEEKQLGKKLNLVYYKASKIRTKAEPTGRDCTGSIIESGPLGNKVVIAENATSTWCLLNATVDEDTGIVLVGDFYDAFAYSKNFSPKHFALGKGIILQGKMFVDKEGKNFIAEVSTAEKGGGIGGLQLRKYSIENGSSSPVYIFPGQVSGFLPQNRISAISWDSAKDKFYSIGILNEGFISSEELYEKAQKGEVKAQLRTIDLLDNKIENTPLPLFTVTLNLDGQISFSLDKTKLIYTSSDLFDEFAMATTTQILALYDMGTGSRTVLLESKDQKHIGPQISPNNEEVLTLVIPPLKITTYAEETQLLDSQNLNNLKIVDVNSKKVRAVTSEDKSNRITYWGWLDDNTIAYISRKTLGEKDMYELHSLEVNGGTDQLIDQSEFINFLGNSIAE